MKRFKDLASKISEKSKEAANSLKPSIDKLKSATTDNVLPFLTAPELLKWSEEVTEGKWENTLLKY